MIINFQKILHTIAPQLEIGGLEVDGASLKFIFIKGKGRKIQILSVDLEPGIIEEGKIRDKDRFAEAVKKLHKKITSNDKKKIYTILSIPDENIYTEIFFIPKAANINLDEAAQLNLQMISPIDFDNAYSDWQVLGEKTEKGAANLEVLGAFVPKAIIDDFEQSFVDEGFELAAVEFPGFGLTRAIFAEADGIDPKQNYLLLKVGADGISFVLVKRGAFYFIHSVLWKNIYGEIKQVTLESIRKVLNEEMKKVLSFYETHSQSPLSSIILVGPTLIERLKNIIIEDFPSLKTIIPTFKNFPDLSLVWASVFGSALRGKISRSKDKLISLAVTGTEKKFENYRIITFIKAWRNVIFVVLGVILFIFSAADLLLGQQIKKVEERLALFQFNPDIYKIDDLKKEALAFNQKANMLFVAASEKTTISLYFERLQEVAGEQIKINRINIKVPALKVFLAGEAMSEEDIIIFKNKMEASSYFSDVILQLSDIKPSGEGMWSFSINFDIEK